MPDPDIGITRVDFDDADAVSQYLEMLDAYALDPMGAGRRLDEETRSRLVADLRQMPGAHCLLARHGDTAIGFATCFTGYSTFRARPLLNIHDIAVLSEWRGQSVGRRLLAEIAELGRQLDCCRITLEVRADNPRARSLYASTGFVPAPCSLFMEKTL
jgi:ribosomal protein S18 acetylase RimI-like enzyme